jgi:hypothetical protein
MFRPIPPVKSAQSDAVTSRNETIIGTCDIPR